MPFGYYRVRFTKPGYRPLEISSPAAGRQRFRLRNATGRPGPAGWELGRFPDGHGDLPVSGISWFEAAAFAEFSGWSLPTIYHWFRAANIWAR